MSELAERARKLRAKTWTKIGFDTNEEDFTQRYDKLIEQALLAERRLAIKELLAAAKFGWMDSLHFEHHVGNDAHPVPIHADDESCREEHTCIDTDGYCTSLEVAVLDAKALRAAAEKEVGK